MPPFGLSSYSNFLFQPWANLSIAEFSVPTAQSGPVGITAGPDSNLWFTEGGGNKIGRSTAGK